MQPLPAALNTLKGFFAGYFHQDWMDEAKHPDIIVLQYLKERRSPTESQAIAEQINQFLELYPNDEDLEKAIFYQLGCYYSPSTDKISTQGWLKNVRTTLLQADAQFHIIYLTDRALISRKKYVHWREIQEDYAQYQASLSYFTLAEMLNFLVDEYHLTLKQKKLIQEFAESDSETLAWEKIFV